MSVIGPLAQALIERDELERRITRLEIKLSQLHDMVRAINQRTLPPTPPTQPHPDFDQEYRKTEDDLK